MFTPSISLTKGQLTYLVGLKHMFVSAQDLTGVPWQLLAGIWTRESFSVVPPHTPGGPMQFDPPLSQSEILHLLQKYTKLSLSDSQAISKKGVNDFPTAVLCTACFLLEKMGKPIKTDADVQIAAWRYNGTAGHDPTCSPYVYNGFDKDHNGMHLVGTIPDGHGGRKKIDIIDHRPGAFTVYMQLIATNS
jgi:hypothetical protein